MSPEEEAEVGRVTWGEMWAEGLGLFISLIAMATCGGDKSSWTNSFSILAPATPLAK